MFCSFEDVFRPSVEKTKALDETLRKTEQEAIDKKQCWMCQNTFKKEWNNHGHKDHTTHCKFTKECVDFSKGTDCSNWSPRDIS